MKPLSEMNKKKLILNITVIIAVASIFTYYFYNYALDIETTLISDSKEYQVDSTAMNKPVVYLSVISRYPPNIIYRGYQPMLDYLTSKSSYRFELKLSDDYTQAVKMLIEKEVAAAFVGSYVYLRAHQDYGIIPILKPLNENFEPFSRAVLFTRGDSKIFSINDLRNKKLALPSRESYSSNWMLKYEFAKNGIVENELAEIKNFPHHQSVIQNVNKNFFDVGVTREYLIKKLSPNSIRTLMYSDPFPTSPLVVTKDYPKKIVQEIKSALLQINQSNPMRKYITKNWDNEFIYGFVEATDKDYDVIRTISR
ncbi:MAG: PhnD/SsuA/transferrin family substrate-binding protein [Melioribacteraceae bacterium]